MATYWHKPAYTAEDRDADGEILPGAMPPGIYCEDEAAYRALLAGAREQGQIAQPGFEGPSLGGMRVYVATPEQAALLRAMPTRSPAEALAHQQAAFDAYDAAAAKLEAWARTFMTTTYEEAVAKHENMTRAMVRQAMRGMSGEEFGRRFMRHAPAGANRKARRAAAAQARRPA